MIDNLTCSKCGSVVSKGEVLFTTKGEDLCARCMGFYNKKEVDYIQQEARINGLLEALTIIRGELNYQLAQGRGDKFAVKAFSDSIDKITSIVKISDKLKKLNKKYEK